MTGPVLELKNLSIGLPKGGDRADAVIDVSLSVAPGEIVCLVGESGSGKSVIAFSAMGLLPRSLPVRAGSRIALQGEDLVDVPEARLRELRCTRMGMIFQEPMTALNPVMRCGDQIDEVLAEHTRLGPAERRKRMHRDRDTPHRSAAAGRGSARSGTAAAPSSSPSSVAPFLTVRRGRRAATAAAHRRDLAGLVTK